MKSLIDANAAFCLAESVSLETVFTSVVYVSLAKFEWLLARRQPGDRENKLPGETFANVSLEPQKPVYSGFLLITTSSQAACSMFLMFSFTPISARLAW